MRIGELSASTGVSVRSLRYYEERGLLGADRSPSGQRHYSDTAVERVQTITELLTAGLNTETIADVLPCVVDASVQTSRLTERLVVERERLDREIEARVRTRDALERLIREAPPLHPGTHAT